MHHMLNPIALRTAKTLWNFGCFECNRVKNNMQSVDLFFITLVQHAKNSYYGYLNNTDHAFQLQYLYITVYI